MVADLPGASREFTCLMDLPIPTGDDQSGSFPVFVIFRSPVHADAGIDQWLMRDGSPRNDREIATEVLVGVEMASIPDRASSALLRNLSVPRILASDQAVALLVSTFLAALPRVDPKVDVVETRARSEGRRERALPESRFLAKVAWIPGNET